MQLEWNIGIERLLKYSTGREARGRLGDCGEKMDIYDKRVKRTNQKILSIHPLDRLAGTW
jgi:hypothetical protein